LDGSVVRGWLRSSLERWGWPKGVVVRPGDKDLCAKRCLSELIQRGDESAIPSVLDDLSDERDEIWLSRTSYSLRHFSSVAVARQLALRLSGVSDEGSLKRLIALLGRFGGESEASLVQRFVEHSSSEIAEVASETYLRLSDPLRVPERWRLF
jgi:hypothetical protein